MTIPLHVSREATPFERGLHFGRAQKAAVECSVRAYRKLFAASRGLTDPEILALGAAYRSALSAQHPELAIEIEGIASGAGQAAEELFALNARTEIIAGSFRPECSVVGFSGGQGESDAWIAQNWDWHMDLRAARVLWEVHPPSGPSFLTVTEAGILAKLGVNSAGLGVLLNLLSTETDGGTDGIPIHAALRLVLSTCHDVDEGRALLESLQFCASSAVSLVDSSGALVTLEVWPGGINAIEPASNGFLTHTNHFCRSIEPARDMVAEQYPDSVARQRCLDQRILHLTDQTHYTAATRLLRSHEGRPHSVCYHDADNPAYLERHESLLSLILLPAAQTVLFTDGSPCRNEYQTRRLLRASPISPQGSGTSIPSERVSGVPSSAE